MHFFQSFLFIYLSICLSIYLPDLFVIRSAFRSTIHSPNSALQRAAGTKS